MSAPDSDRRIETTLARLAARVEALGRDELEVESVPGRQPSERRLDPPVAVGRTHCCILPASAARG